MNSPPTLFSGIVRAGIVSADTIWHYVKHSEKYGCCLDVWLPRVTWGKCFVAEDMFTASNRSAQGQGSDRPPEAKEKGQIS